MSFSRGFLVYLGALGLIKPAQTNFGGLHEHLRASEQMGWAHMADRSFAKAACAWR